MFYLRYASSDSTHPVSCSGISKEGWGGLVRGTVSNRVFNVTVTGPTMVLLHAYKKQGQKAPPREIRAAESRIKEVVRDN